MALSNWVGWLFGWDNDGPVQAVRVAWGSEWAKSERGLFWLFLAVIGIVVLSVLFYYKLQACDARWTRRLLAMTRSTLLILLVISLADPVFQVTSEIEKPPTMFVVVDGTASMEIRDQYLAEVEQSDAELASPGSIRDSNADSATRLELVQSWFGRASENALGRLFERSGCRYRVFTFDGTDDSNLRELFAEDESNDAPRALKAPSAGSQRFLPNATDTGAEPAVVDLKTRFLNVGKQLRATGQVTALGNVFRQLAWHPDLQSSSGVVFISDFAHNFGEDPTATAHSQNKPVIQSLVVPVFAVGVGALSTEDLAVELFTETRIRRGEMTTLRVRVLSAGDTQVEASLRIEARPLSKGDDDNDWIQVDELQLSTDGAQEVVEVPFVPPWSGVIELRVTTDELPNEIVTGNNSVVKRIDVIDEYVRLLYVADEPTWEWRFLKEVLHRDPAVGTRGFCTYLASSDPRVRQTNPLFMNALNQDRSEFFENDVVILDDVSRATLTEPFCAMVREFVGEMGGGLIVLAGPANGARGVLGTAIEDLMPVRVQSSREIRDQEAFPMQRTDRSKEFAFMQLGDSPGETDRLWDGLGLLPWYQPVASIDERSVVLAEHPTDRCDNRNDLQPLIVLRRFGNGEVIYLAFNEMWRLRRGVGGEHYRRFWLSAIDRLALSHSLGAEKRFVVRTDRSQYSVGEDVLVTVKVYDGNYEPLKIASGDRDALEAVLIRLDDIGSGQEPVPMRVEAMRSGVFEARFPVLRSGRFEISVTDPFTGSSRSKEFDVSATNGEYAEGALDTELQSRIARISGGEACLFVGVDRLMDGLRLEPHREIIRRVYPIWSTPLCFVLVVLLMLSEWAFRKWVGLA